MAGIIVLTLFLIVGVGTLVWSVKHDFTKNRETGEHEQEEKPKKRTRKKVKDESESREN